MKLYVACLASYNNGRLHGAWIDASSDVDEMQEEIAAMLRGSPYPNVMVDCPLCEGDGETTFHNSETGDTRRDKCPTCTGSGQVPSAEEWAVHDYDGFPNMGEYPSLEDIAAFVELTEEHDHIEPDDLAKIVADFSTVDEASEALQDQFCGIFDSFRDYADEAADDMLAAHDIKGDNPLARYFDYESFARDLGYDMRTIDVSSGVAVFYV